MIHELGRLECSICGRSIYYPLAETDLKDGKRLIELTCSRGHTDGYWDIQWQEVDAQVTPHAEAARAAVVGF